MRAALRRAFDYLSAIEVSVPGSATVDPSKFPEDEYPVRCLHCGYLLRGESAGCCPECGTAYDRGELLVAIYARGKVPRGTSRLVAPLIWLGLACLVGTLLLLAAFTLLVSMPAPPSGLIGWMTPGRALIMPIIMGAGWALLHLAMFVQALCLPPRHKRHAVRAAVRREGR